jgi:hypothetical protein
MNPTRLACLALLLLLATLAASFPATRPADPDRDTKAALDRPLSAPVRFDGVPFANAVDRLAAASGVQLFAEYDRLAAAGVKRDAPVTFHGDGVKLSAAIAGIIDAAAGRQPKAWYAVVGHVVVLSTPADLSRLHTDLMNHRYASAKGSAAINRPLPQVAFDRIPLATVAGALADAGHVAVHPDWAALGAAGIDRTTPVTIHLHDVPFGDAVLLVLNSIGDDHRPLDYQVEPDGSVTLSTDAALTAAANAADNAAAESVVRAQLDRELPQVRFNANQLSDVVDFLRDVSGANIFPAWDALARAGVKGDAPVTYDAKHVKLGGALADTLDAAAGGKGKAVVGIVGHAVVLATPAHLARLRADLARHRAAGEPAALARRLPELKFNANACSDVFDFLRDVAGMKFQIDWPALDAAGVTVDTPVTCRLRDVPMDESLVLLLGSVGDAAHPLDYRVGPDGTVTVSTAAALAGAMPHHAP